VSVSSIWFPDEKSMDRPARGMGAVVDRQTWPCTTHLGADRRPFLLEGLLYKLNVRVAGTLAKKRIVCIMGWQTMGHIRKLVFTISQNTNT
jgi:hypothetical protein